MSRGKRVRKARAASKRQRRLSRLSVAASALAAEARQRGRLREAIDAAALPASLKLVAGLLVDPAGEFAALCAKKARQA